MPHVVLVFDYTIRSGPAELAASERLVKASELDESKVAQAHDKIDKIAQGGGASQPQRKSSSLNSQSSPTAFVPPEAAVRERPLRPF